MNLSMVNVSQALHPSLVLSRPLANPKAYVIDVKKGEKRSRACKTNLPYLFPCDYFLQ